MRRLAQLRLRCAETKETDVLRASLEAELDAVEEDVKRVEQELSAARSEARGQQALALACGPLSAAPRAQAKKALAVLAKTEEAVRQTEAMERLKIEAEHNGRINRLMAELERVREDLDIRVRVIGAEMVRWRAQAEAAAAAVRDAKDEVRFPRFLYVRAAASDARILHSSWIASASWMSRRSAWTGWLRSSTLVRRRLHTLAPGSTLTATICAQVAKRGWNSAAPSIRTWSGTASKRQQRVLSHRHHRQALPRPTSAQALPRRHRLHSKRSRARQHPRRARGAATRALAEGKRRRRREELCSRAAVHTSRVLKHARQGLLVRTVHRRIFRLFGRLLSLAALPFCLVKRHRFA